MLPWCHLDMLLVICIFIFTIGQMLMRDIRDDSC